MPRKSSHIFLTAPVVPERPLSTREKEVLESLSKGLTYKEIADTLAVSIDTVREHCRNIYGKPQVHSRTAAVVKFLSK